VIIEEELDKKEKLIIHNAAGDRFYFPVLQGFAEGRSYVSDNTTPKAEKQTDRRIEEEKGEPASKLYNPQGQEADSVYKQGVEEKQEYIRDTAAHLFRPYEYVTVILRPHHLY